MHNFSEANQLRISDYLLHESVKMKIDESVIDFLKQKMKEVKESGDQISEILKELQYFSLYNQDYIKKSTPTIVDHKHRKMPLLSEAIFGNDDHLFFLQTIDRKYGKRQKLNEALPALLAPAISALTPALKTLAMTYATDLAAKYVPKIMSKIDDKIDDYASKLGPGKGFARVAVDSLKKTLHDELKKKSPDYVKISDYIKELKDAHGIPVDESDLFSPDEAIEIEKAVEIKTNELHQEELQKFLSDIKSTKEFQVFDFEDGFIIILDESKKRRISKPLSKVNKIKKTYDVEYMKFSEASAFKAAKDPKYKPNFDAPSDPLILAIVAPVGSMDRFKSYVEENVKEGKSKSGLPDFELRTSDQRKLTSDLSSFGKDPDLKSILKFIESIHDKLDGELADLQTEVASLGGSSIFNFSEKKKINKKLKRFMALINIQSSFLKSIKDTLKTIDRMILKDDDEKPIILIRTSKGFLFEEKTLKQISNTASKIFEDSIALDNLAVQSNSDWWAGLSKRLSSDSAVGAVLPSFFGSGKEISEVLSEISSNWKDLGHDLVITSVLCSSKQLKKIMSEISGATIVPLSSGAGSSGAGSSGYSTSIKIPIAASSITPIKTNDIIDSSLNWVQRKAVRKGARSNLKNKLNQALKDAGVVDGDIFESIKNKKVLKESKRENEESFARMRKLAGLED